MGTSVLERAFHRVEGALHCEGVPAERIAEAAGTPVYVYSASAIRERYALLDGALGDTPHRIHYSCKANGTLALLGIIRALGGGIDVVSGGELHRALKAGFAGADIVFGGVGKTEAELRAAVDAGVKLVNVESEAEVHLLARVAAERGAVVPVALRVNPEVTIDNFHAHIATGAKGHKFGIPYDEAEQVALLVASEPSLALAGLDMHVGSQLFGLESYANGVERLIALVDRIRAAAPETARTMRYLDMGGGFAVTYADETPPDLGRLGLVAADAHRRTGLEILVEPGRFLVGNSGVLLTRVLYRKRSGGKEFVITDAGMNDLLRPSHYDAYHRIESVAPAEGRVVADVVGPVCETGDFLARDREVDDVEPGALVVVHTAGAYGTVMASNYNARPRAAEVLVDGERFGIVTRRETLDEIVARETVSPDWIGA